MRVFKQMGSLFWTALLIAIFGAGAVFYFPSAIFFKMVEALAGALHKLISGVFYAYVRFLKKLNNLELWTK